MSSDRIPVSNAALNPAELARVEQIVFLMRSVLAPVLDANIDDIEVWQSAIITASGLMAGTTVGHMTVVGSMKQSDHKRAAKVVAVNFKQGIRFGIREATDAVRQQSTVN